MQVYKTASLMTAKPTEQEMSQIPHFLVDFLPASVTSFSVCEYQKLALAALEEVKSRNKLPVVVGGTMYYVESILYDRPFNKPEDPSGLNEDTQDLYNQLKALDPEYAWKVNPNNRRRIRNALLYIKETGKLYSQKNPSASIRTPSILIWLTCEKEVLKQRITQRINKMLEEGGLQEIYSVLREAQHNDFTRGVLQSIGYKEFEPLLSQGEEVLPQCIENLVTATMQYSKKQVRWIKNRMQPFIEVHEIDTTHVEEWDQIKKQAIEVVQSANTLKGKIEIPKPQVFQCEACRVKVEGSAAWEAHLHSKSHLKKTTPPPQDDSESRYCEKCGRDFKGLKSWEAHLKSRQHRRRSRSRPPQP